MSLSNASYLSNLQNQSSSRFVRKITNKMKGGKQPVGINTLNKYTKEIAGFLGLKEPDRYTTHSLRRTGATILAEAGLSLATIKAAGGWRSDTVASGYIVHSTAMQRSISEAIQQQGLTSVTIDKELRAMEASIQGQIQNLTIVSGGTVSCTNFTVNIYGSVSSASTKRAATTELGRPLKKARKEDLESDSDDDSSSSSDDDYED